MRPSTPAAPPVVDLALKEAAPVSPWIGYCRAALIFTGVCYVVFGVAMVPAFVWSLAPEDADVAPVVGLVTFVLGAGLGALNFVAARGLKNEARWAWILSLALAALYVSSACFPIGIVLLVGLLREDVRSRFLVG